MWTRAWSGQRRAGPGWAARPVPDSSTVAVPWSICSPAEAGPGREGPARAGAVGLAVEQLAHGGRGHRPGVGDRVPLGGQVAPSLEGPQVVDGQVEVAAAEVAVALLDRGRLGAGRAGGGGRGRLAGGQPAGGRVGAAGQRPEQAKASQTRRQASHRPGPPSAKPGPRQPGDVYHPGRWLRIHNGAASEEGRLAFPERLLSEDEELVYDLRPHWLTLVVPVLLTVAVVLAVGAALGGHAGRRPPAAGPAGRRRPRPGRAAGHRGRAGPALVDHPLRAHHRAADLPLRGGGQVRPRDPPGADQRRHLLPVAVRADDRRRRPPARVGRGARPVPLLQHPRPRGRPAGDLPPDGGQRPPPRRLRHHPAPPGGRRPHPDPARPARPPPSTTWSAWPTSATAAPSPRRSSSA